MLLNIIYILFCVVLLHIHSIQQSKFVSSHEAIRPGRRMTPIVTQSSLLSFKTRPTKQKAGQPIRLQSSVIRLRNDMPSHLPPTIQYSSKTQKQCYSVQECTSSAHRTE